ncbi:WD-40 repeat protein [Zostera marina]|uniref:WD-40 repeat protein n=1 Tax=Zostera marina TaxID=29655 RepID=A0A0K9P195_ZOSMR|nr:WD-40 repeat protein [Zostera marina]
MEINLGKVPFDLDFHPSSPLLATALISGDLHLYRYVADGQSQRILNIAAHTESCRAVRFVNSGEVLLTASPDLSLLATDVETGTAIARLNDAHGAAINRVISLSETTVASGDDEGCIKVWDIRSRTCCNTFEAHEDWISDMTSVNQLQLIATSGDGTLSVCNLRKNKVENRSEFSEDELLSVIVMKNGRKVVCGSQSGVLLLYSWGQFDDCSDRFTGIPMSIDALLKFDENTLISGSEDGILRLVGILPNRIIQPLAEHSEYPIEGIAFSHDREFLGSISHSPILKLWNMQELLANTPSFPSDPITTADSDDEMAIDENVNQGSRVRRSAGGQSSVASSNFFADL